jgi:hypothetical protein
MSACFMHIARISPRVTACRFKTFRRRGTGRVDILLTRINARNTSRYRPCRCMWFFFFCFTILIMTVVPASSCRRRQRPCSRSIAAFLPSSGCKRIFVLECLIAFVAPWLFQSLWRRVRVVCFQRRLPSVHVGREFQFLAICATFAAEIPKGRTKDTIQRDEHASDLNFVLFCLL